jgi:hypothetical protein
MEEKRVPFWILLRALAFLLRSLCKYLSAGDNAMAGKVEGR